MIAAYCEPTNKSIKIIYNKLDKVNTVIFRFQNQQQQHN